MAIRSGSIFIVSFLIVFSLPSYGQLVQPGHLEQVWLSYMNQSRLTNKIGVGFDLQLKTKDHFTQRLSQSMMGPSFSYYPTDKARVSLGYTYVSNYAIGKYQSLTQPEHRIWQQAQWANREKRVKTMLSLRLEEKYKRKTESDTTLRKDFSFNYRTRTMLGVQLPLGNESRKPNVSFVISDEVYFNFGKQITYNHFDQNWFFTGFAIHLTGQDNIQLGYMNVFQQLPQGHQYRTIHVARVSYFQFIDWRKPSFKNG